MGKRKEESIPEEIRKYEEMTMEELLRKAFGFQDERTISYTDINYRTYLVNGNILTPILNEDRFNHAYGLCHWYNCKSVSALDKEGNLWASDITFERVCLKNPEHPNDQKRKICWREWKKQTKLTTERRKPLYNDGEIQAVLKNKHPYAFKFMKRKGYSNWETILIAPQLEQLSTAGFRFADWLLELPAFSGIEVGKISSFNRLCKMGTSPENILQVPKCIYNKMKDETDLSLWDTVRKLAKSGIPYDTCADMYEMCKACGRDSDKVFESLRTIMRMEYDDKKVFPTWQKLKTYLERIDMHEAIGIVEGTQLLADYIRMCSDLGIKPRTDSDSLKREHDVTARLYLQRSQAICRQQLADSFDKAAENLKERDYAEKTFFIRGIRSYDDLMDEASMQHNCVASYANDIVSGKSLIYTMRECKSPEKSLITVEIDKDLHIRQAYLSCNRKVTNQAQLAFLDRWIKHLREPGYMPSRIPQKGAA